MSFAVCCLALFAGSVLASREQADEEEMPPPLSPYKFNQRAGQRLVYGDIMLSPKQLKLSRWAARTGTPMAKHIAIKARPENRWPNNEIPFEFSPKFSERQRHAIREALAVLEANSCFRFVPRNGQKDFLFVDMREGCFSFVGKVGGRQLLSLAAGCLHDYIIWHEVMHALGLEHEHQRPDRDKHIRIRWQNVEPDKHINFEKIPYADVDLYHTYDYHSLMHYDGTAFGRVDSRTGEPMTTMEPLKSGVKLTDNFELTRLDVEKLRILSNCGPEKLKLRPVLQPQLVTDPGSVEEGVECTDKSHNCGTLKKKGFCVEIRYVRLIRIQCQRTCGFCEQMRKNETTSREKESGEDGGGERESAKEQEEEEEGVDRHYTRWTFPRRKNDARQRRNLD